MAKSKPRHGHSTGKPHPVDIHVGTRVRQCRTLLGMTQTGLGDALGLTFQQVQKYERGANRVGSSRLYDLSRVFDVPVGFFFDDMPTAMATSSQAKRRGRIKKLPSYDPGFLTKRETLELVRAYYKIEDAGVRKGVYQLIKGVAADAEKGS
jgi:transcriptional regulator with XRE-family HTH domain